MSETQTLRGLINQRLSLAAEEIFELFERTIAEYEEQLCRAKRGHHRVLDSVFNPEVRLYRTDVQTLLVKEEETQEEEQHEEEEEEIIQFTFSPAPVKTDEDGHKDLEEQLQTPEEADVKFTVDPVRTDEDEDEEEKPPLSLLHLQTEDAQQLFASKEEQQDLNPGLDQEDKLEPLHIKEEWEELHGLEETDIKPPFTPLPVKTDEDDDEEKPQPSQLDPNQSEDCGGSEETSSELGTDDSHTWEEAGEPAPQTKAAPVTEMEHNTGDTSMNDSDAAKRLKRKKKKSDKPYTCKVCGKTYQQKLSYRRHYTRFHLIAIGPKNFPCSLCKKKFKCKDGLVQHMRDHTGEKPYKCSLCDEAFKRPRPLKVHIMCHSEEKPLPCPARKTGFRSPLLLSEHRQTHSRLLPTCSLCKITFRTKKKFYRHMKTHAREKPFSCSVCEKSFLSKETLKRHMTIHKKPKSFSCGVCNKSYTAWYIKNHKCKAEKAKPDRVRCGACKKNFTASYHKKHKCKAKEGKVNGTTEAGLKKPQGSADLSDQHVVFSDQNSRDQMFPHSVIQRFPVIRIVGSQHGASGAFS